jgi:hypothetical protein
MRLRPGTALLLAALATGASRAQAPLRPQPGEPVAVRSAPSPEAEGFRSPLDVPLKLTGTFGELRSNHFHAGLDVATEGVTGLPVYACADGWVRRISVSPWGYGLALYIEHPNGLTTVYGHLDRLEEPLAGYLRGRQGERQSWALDVGVPRNALPVRRGQVVARSGNSGSSGGPHLHFEVRRGDTPLNPMAHGFEVADHRAPEMRALYVYPRWDDLPGQPPARIPLYRNGNTWSPAGGVVRSGGQRIGLGLDAWDRQDARENRNGIYAAELYVDGRRHWAFRFDSLDFGVKRGCNAHLDYREYAERGTRVHRLFKLPGNPLGLYPALASGGLIDGGLVSEGAKPGAPPLQPAAYAVEIVLEDYAGNRSRVAFRLEADPDARPAAPSGDTLLYWFREHRLGGPEAFLRLPRGTLYENAWWSMGPDGDGPWGPRWAVGDDGVALHGEVDLALRAKALPARLAPRAVVLHRDGRGRTRVLKGRWENGYVHARTDRLGRFHVDVDTVAPELSPRGWRPGGVAYGDLRFSVRDDRSGILDWDAWVDSVWRPLAFDPKRALLAWEGAEVLEPGEHTVVVQVTDACGNAVRRRWRFRR